MQRLGKNHDGYGGERIDIRPVLDEIRALALERDWRVEVLPGAEGADLLALVRPVVAPQTRIYLSTGIHGDEPAGPLAVRQLVQESLWPPHAEVYLCPCLNPNGFPLNQRLAHNGVDPNRDYRHQRLPEVRAHIAWLERQPAFDLTLCLHEDWEAAGFYLYELNPDGQPSLAAPMIRGVVPVCPIDPSTLIDGREARSGIIRPNLDPATRPEWAEAFYLIRHKTRLSYTLEAPSDFPLATRVAALVAAVGAAVSSSCILANRPLRSKIETTSTLGPRA